MLLWSSGDKMICSFVSFCSIYITPFMAMLMGLSAALFPPKEMDKPLCIKGLSMWAIELCTVATALTTLRSKKITICLIIQSLAQLDLLYGPAQRRVILDNCAYKAILGASDAETQEYFSRLVGTVEATRQGQSTSYAADGDEQRGHTISQHTVDRRIVQPHEFATLRDVVLLTPCGYYRAGKIKPIDT